MKNNFVKGIICAAILFITTTSYATEPVKSNAVFAKIKVVTNYHVQNSNITANSITELYKSKAFIKATKKKQIPVVVTRSYIDDCGQTLTASITVFCCLSDTEIIGMLDDYAWSRYNLWTGCFE